MFHKILVAYFAAFIFFWALGVDQLFFAVFCLVGTLTYLTSSDMPAPGREVLMFALFLAATLVSVLQIDSVARYITYFRNEGVYLTMLLIFVSASFASARDTDLTDKLYFALFLFSLQCTVVAFFASNGMSLAFKSLAGYVIPDMGSNYIKGMLNKSTVQAEALWFAQGFYRPRGLMMYPNTMAGILASSMALKAYFVYKFWRDKFRFFAIVTMLAIYIDIFSIYSSLSRSTWAGFAFAIAVFPFVYKTRLAAKLLPILVGVLVVAMVILTGLSEGIEARLFEKTHSNEGRGLNYLLIWQHTTSGFDKFFFGHGTQIDHWMLDIPLGSHSTYLGVFFKFGTIGAIFFLMFLFFLYRRSVALTNDVRQLSRYDIEYKRPYFLCFAMIVPVVQMTFIEVDVDFSYAMYFSTLVFLIAQESRIVKEKLYEVEGEPGMLRT